MKSVILLFGWVLMPVLSATYAQSFQPTPPAPASEWPDSLPWWQRNNLRTMQNNLPAYEGGLDVDSLIQDLQRFSVNTLIINGGGIMAFYPTQLDFQYVNPYMQEDMLDHVIEQCHAHGIRVITRFDFSRIHRSLFEQHPDWAYVSAKGERIINDDMYMVAINAPYVQEKSIQIVEEVIDRYAIDGIFINMPGYRTGNAYEGTSFGIDQNTHDQRRFREFSQGMDLPQQESEDDPAWATYETFKAYTIDDWMQRMHRAVKSKNPNIAICTYMDEYVDIIRHETQTNSLPYWPYMASDNVNNTIHSYPHHIVSNASIQQISFQSRYNAIEPEETVIRLYENLANGSGLDMSMMGDFREYEDERNFDAWETLYAFHQKYEPYFGRYTSPAEICVIAPGSWPHGEEAQEYRGIQLMLKEAHLQYDIIEDSQLAARADELSRYKLVILPQIVEVPDGAADVLRNLCQTGTSLIATNQSLSADSSLVHELFGARIDSSPHDGAGFYLHPDDKTLFKRLKGQSLVFWKFNLGLYNFADADTTALPIYTPGRPGPPEKIGGHEPSGYSAIGLKTHGKGTAALMPVNVGRLYFLHGYEEHKNLFLDLVDRLFPEAGDLVQTNVHPRVEVVLQHYTENLPDNVGNDTPDGLMLHLVNLTGFSGNTYFSPLPVHDLDFRIRCAQEPAALYSLQQQREIPFRWKSGYLTFTLEELQAFDGLVIARQNK